MPSTQYPATHDNARSFTSPTAETLEYDAESTQYTGNYAKSRYRYVLNRVLFCVVERVDPCGGEPERVIFYKDGTVCATGVTDGLLTRWAGATWVGDFNMAFWQIRRAARALALGDPAYSFVYDAGLPALLALCAAID